MHTAEAAAAPAAAPAAPAWISMPDQANSCLIAQILMLDQAWQATVWYQAEPIRGCGLGGLGSAASFVRSSVRSFVRPLVRPLVRMAGGIRKIISDGRRDSENNFGRPAGFRK